MYVQSMLDIMTALVPKKLVLTSEYKHRRYIVHRLHC